MKYDFNLPEDAGFDEKAVVALSKVGMKVIPATVKGIDKVVAGVMMTGYKANIMVKEQFSKHGKK